MIVSFPSLSRGSSSCGTVPSCRWSQRHRARMRDRALRSPGAAVLLRVAVHVDATVEAMVELAVRREGRGMASARLTSRGTSAAPCPRRRRDNYNGKNGGEEETGARRPVHAPPPAAVIHPSDKKVKHLVWARR